MVWYNIEYVYSPESIRRTLTYLASWTIGSNVTTYYINNSGLADSCYTNYYNRSENLYFHYDSDNYLKMVVKKNPVTGQIKDTTFYYYSDGNLIKKMIYGKFPTTYSYYNNLKNLIDIESFIGNFLGKQNQNLIKSSSVPPEKEFEYILNSDGLVKERKGKGYNHRYIDYFEYTYR
jgi:hypothetical protein